MSDATSQGSLRRVFLYLCAAIPIAAVIFALATALGSAPAPKVAFDMKLKVSGQDIRASGTIYVEGDSFSFAANRLNFTGTISGDDVKISGKVTAGERSQMREFATSGQLANNRLSATLNGDRGSRLGTLKLELINR
jgi:hypothetical protein